MAKVTDGTINCTCHGSKYDIATGAVDGGPGHQPLPAKTVTVKGDQASSPRPGRPRPGDSTRRAGLRSR